MSHKKLNTEKHYAGGTGRSYRKGGERFRDLLEKVASTESQKEIRTDLTVGDDESRVARGAR